MSWLSGRLFGPVLVLVLGMPMAAAAQTGGSWQIAPHAGVFLPLGGLGQVPISTQIAGAGPRLSVVSLGLEVADQLSLFRFEADGPRRLQNDVHALLSVRIGMF